jgi:hypothetical protein
MEAFTEVLGKSPYCRLVQVRNAFQRHVDEDSEYRQFAHWDCGV